MIEAIYEERNGPPERLVKSGEYCDSKDCEFRDENKNCDHPDPQFEKAWSSHDIFPFWSCKTWSNK